ncbi:MAG: alpha-hydroxy-acid oxidizing protein [Synergistaceae bacterium]|jgi:isopentenyl diphosphate isomerase/L-lactate dehydrogenase-like FMN-dependent dehydrogenase|nr:alpha-hydroxy-acid oxidizing protein [Synergistaceae bacterium]
MIGTYIDESERKLQEKGIASRYSGARGNSPRITREYNDSLLIEMRVIDSVRASTKFKLFGAEFSMPVMTAALSSLDNVYPGGMVELARGAAAADAVMWAGIGDEKELAAMTATGAKTIKIVKPYADHDQVYEKLAQVEKHGAFATGMDIDFVFGNRLKRGYAMSYPVGPKTLNDLKGFVKATKLPFILKGVLSEKDAVKALEAGAAGIVVSHHGGGVLDYAAPPLMVLPRIVKVIGGQIPIFVDCGMASGADVFKALALGANAVCIGRAVMGGLASEGAEGVRQILAGINEELRDLMSLTGAPDLQSIDPEVILHL